MAVSLVLKTNIGAKNAVFDLVSTRSPHVRVVKNAWCLSSLFLRVIPSTLWVNRVWPQFFSAILSVSGFRWSTNNVEYRYSMCLKLMSPKIKTGRNPALQNKCISHEFRCPRFACLHTTYQITTRSDFRICPLACLGFTNCPIAKIYQSCIEHYSQDS